MAVVSPAGLGSAFTGECGEKQPPARERQNFTKPSTGCNADNATVTSICCMQVGSAVITANDTTGCPLNTTQLDNKQTMTAFMKCAFGYPGTNSTTCSTLPTPSSAASTKQRGMVMGILVLSLVVELVMATH
ncbi:hypothetical protein BV22DRAFT_722230 [Leucogyrophana mollusca]|uniref:Uncharacterized protein n=1 Tax=Leucogyrophana mollusca TaxID=85980 RepID=A0ACB8B8N3_9AGAM|nr:hypothetical protein BV22DRAFT_722230 [Leucogyrophana mollusca]